MFPIVLETPSTKPARVGDKSMMFAQYPEWLAMFMPSAPENNAAAAKGVTASRSDNNTATHTDGEPNAATCESFRAASGVSRLVTMKCSITAAQPFPMTTLAMYLLRKT